jgi:hypothetical protein
MPSEPKPEPERVTLTAGQAEAWTTGDFDLLQHDAFANAINDAQEKVSRGDHESAEVVVVITKEK